MTFLKYDTPDIYCKECNGRCVLEDNKGVITVTCYHTHCKNYNKRCILDVKITEIELMELNLPLPRKEAKK